MLNGTLGSSGTSIAVEGTVSRFGHWGRILRVDLSTGSLGADQLDDDSWRLYAGGSLLATRLLLAETPRGLDAFDPAAVLIVASSAVAGHRAPALPRFSVVAKSPLTGGIGEARAEGPFGIALKACGFDALVIGGASERPVALTIVDGRPKLIPADDLWGLDTSQVVDALEVRLGPCHVATIGPAGERLVRFAGVVADRSFAAPRMGLGAVMGAKRLKAVAIVGGEAPPVADPGALDAIRRAYAGAVDRNPVTRWQRRPPGFGAWVGGAPAGSYAVENFRTSAFDARGYLADAFEQRLAWSADGCPGCPSDCIKGFAGSPDAAAVRRTAERREGGLHQEAIAALGPNLGLGNLGDVIDLNGQCLRLGLDPVSTGFTLSFAMECREAGIATGHDLDGLDLRFGQASAATAMVDRIARREGSGDWLAEGSARAATHVEGAAGRYALTVKGLELPPFDPRAQAGLALGFATAPFGPRYDVAEHDADYDDEAPSWPHALELSRPLGIVALSPATAQTPQKVRDFAVLAQLWSGFDALLVCPFASAPVRILSLDDVARLVRAVTGWQTSSDEVMGWGARRLQLMRIYNIREGLGATDDALPDRFFDEPLDAGRHAGTHLDRRAFAAMIARYYELMGWDREGVPTLAARSAHHLEWTAFGEERGWPSTPPSA
jgi:aldehyde:ferredoxin oxidoreductase